MSIRLSPWPHGALSIQLFIGFFPKRAALGFFFFLPQFSLFRSYFAVSVVLKERRSKDSVTLAWQGPERPSGAIVEYEVIYYEKVRRKNPQTHTQMNLY